MSLSNPVTPEVLANLTPQEQRELLIWQKAHSPIWDLRFHLPASCPFFFTFEYMFTWNKKTPKWARRVYRLFQSSHKEEDHCDCDAQIAAANK